MDTEEPSLEAVKFSGVLIWKSACRAFGYVDVEVFACI